MGGGWPREQFICTLNRDDMLFMFMSKMAMDLISSSYFTFLKSVLYEPLIAAIEQDRDDYGLVKSSCVSVIKPSKPPRHGFGRLKIWPHMAGTE